jgi:hypothetical protein
VTCVSAENASPLPQWLGERDNLLLWAYIAYFLYFILDFAKDLR